MKKVKKSRIIEYEISTNKLESDTIMERIIISDLHGWTNNKALSDQLAEDILRLKPKNIYIAGDILEGWQWESKQCLINLRDFLYKLSENSKVYLAMGNHDLHGMNHKNRDIRSENYQDLKSVRDGSVYPLYNEVIEDDDFILMNYTPNRHLLNGISTRKHGKAHDDFIKEYSKSALKINNPGNKIVEFLGHNPHLFSESYKNIGLEDLSMVDVFYTGHLHNGYIKLDNVINNPEKYMDYGYSDMPYVRDENGKLILKSINPLYFGKLNLTRGTVFINNDSKQVILELNNGAYFRKSINSGIWLPITNEEAYNEIENNNLHALVVSGGVKRYNNLPVFNDNPEITRVRIKGIKNKK